MASVRWQLVRQIPTDQPNVPSRFLGGEPIEFGGNSVSIRPEPDMAAVLSRTGITFLRENKVIAETALVNGIGIDNNFGGTYLTGLKSQPVAFSNDLSRVFVAGKGQIYVIDLVSFKLIDTINVPAAGNISSLVTTGNMLIIAEGSSYGSGGSRLLVMDTSPRASADQDTVEPPSIVSLKGTGVEGAPKGVHGMAVGPDGYTLVVTVPQAANSFAAFVGNLPKGNVLIFDLRTLNLKTGMIDAPVVADLPSDGISGKGPETVTATYDADRFLVATPNDFDRGLSTLVLTRDADGKVTGAKLTAIRMFQPGSSIKLDRLDIQRADSAVLVEPNGIEYAVVADDNYNFKDTYWMAMFEAPMWIQLVPLQFGPPTAVGGSASAKQVNFGGKIGIIQDPFGTPKFMGATLPLDGYGIKNLSMSEYGRVVIGQLAGYLGTNKSTTSPNLNYAWNIDSLIDAAINMPENKRLRDHLTPVAAEGKVPSMVINGAYTAWAPAGTAFDPDEVEVTFHGRAGDINMINLQDLIKEAYEYPDFQAITEFFIDPMSINSLRKKGDNPQIVGLTKTSQTGVLEMMSTLADGTTPGDFSKTGILHAYRQIAPDELETLRAGGRLNDLPPRIVSFSYLVKLSNGQREWRDGRITIDIKDVPPSNGVFFGDRPLDNPGYSEMKLGGTVAIGSKGLDAYKVEQRLKYLGYSGFEKTGLGALTEFSVDGSWGTTETTALRGFYGATHYSGWAYGGGGKGYDGTNTPAAQAAFMGSSDPKNSKDDTNLEWLNAYNAPHMIDLYAALPVPGSRFTNGQGVFEKYSTSWTLDLLTAWRQTQDRLIQLSPAQQATVLVSNSIRVNGLTSPQGEVVGHQKGGHSILMSLDQGLAGIIDSIVMGSPANNQEVSPMTPCVRLVVASRF